jgi:hypothetical protein
VLESFADRPVRLLRGSPPVTREEKTVSDTEQSRQEREGDHPELDRAYDRDRGGQVPEHQEESGEYRGPDLEDDEPGQGDVEDQGV